MVSGCALQPDYVRPVAGPSGLITSARTLLMVPAPDDQWWRKLNNPSIDYLVQKTLESNPDLDVAVSKIMEARSNAGIADAGQYPVISAVGSINRSKAQTGVGNATTVGNVGNAGLNLSWELDIFGRVRESRNAASRKIEARQADANLIRLSLITQVIDGVTNYDACLTIVDARLRSVNSKISSLRLIRQQADAGFLAATNEVQAQSDVLAANVGVSNQQKECDHLLNELVFFSGLPIDEIKPHFSGEHKTMLTQPAVDSEGTLIITSRSPFPAEVLMSHPRVASAEREVASAYAAIGVARAERYPAINLSAMLSGQWIRAGSSSINTTTWALGPAIAATLFDGGALASNIDLNVARWQGAVGTLNKEVRAVTQDIQNALADEEVAYANTASASASLINQYRVLHSIEAKWQAGMVSQLELENIRGQCAVNEEQNINASRDQMLAWISLIKATASPTLFLRKAS